MTLGAYPLGTTALGAKKTPEQILITQSTWAGISSNILALVRVFDIKNTSHGLMSSVVDISIFTPKSRRTLKAVRTRLTSSSKTENRITHPTNNRTLRI